MPRDNPLQFPVSRKNGQILLFAQTEFFETAGQRFLGGGGRVRRSGQVNRYDERGQGVILKGGLDVVNGDDPEQTQVLINHKAQRQGAGQEMVHDLGEGGSFPEGRRLRAHDLSDGKPLHQGLLPPPDINAAA